MSNKLILIDGSSVLSKHFFATLPNAMKFAKTQEDKDKAMEQIMKTKDGKFTNAVFGMSKFLLKLIKEQQPSHMIIAWDLNRNTFRRAMYSEYKAQRGATPSPLKSQFELAQKMLSFCGLENNQFILEGLEAL